MPSKPDFFHSTVWTRPPRARVGQPALSREQIVRAAIDLLDAEGTTGLSMRKLGTRLGSGATSVYWHVANKDELLELAVDEVLGEIYVPEPDDTSWRIGASVLANSMRSALLRHPWVIGLLGTKPTVGPNAMRMGDRMVALLTRAGFDGMALAHVSSLLNAQAIGSATTQAAIVEATRQSGVPATDIIKELEPYLESIGPDHPHYEQWRRKNMMTGLDPYKLWDESFAFGLERVLDGLELWLAAGKPATPNPQAAT
jgi:AcrR family transcriptional regulator